jgi:ferrous iron transport protein A
MDSQPLTALKIGAAGTVSEIKLRPDQRGRLLEMGLLVGTPVQLVRFAPLGDPVEIKVRGYHLTLRRHDAEQIWVQPKQEGDADAIATESQLGRPASPRA